MSSVVPTEAEPIQLQRRLGALGLAFIFIAFNAPLAVLAGYLQPAIAFGNGIGAPVAFLVAGAVLLLFQIGCLAMSRHMKSPGAFYCYLAEGIGKPPALAGSILASMAYILFAVSGFVFLGLVVVAMMTQLFGTEVLPWQAWSLIGIVLVTVLNLLRVDLSAKFVAICVALEIALVAVYQAVVMVQGGPEGYSASSFSPVEFLSGNVGLAVLFALNTMIGVEAMAVFREEVRDPARTVPRAAYSAIVFTTLFFALAAWAYIIAVGPSNAVEAARTAPVDSVLGTFETYMGGFLPTLIAVLLVTSQLAAANSVQGSSVRYLFTLGHDQVLPARLAHVHPRLGSPHIAVATSVGITLAIFLGLIAFSDDVVLIYGAIGGFGVMCLLPLLLGTCVAVVIFFRRRPGLEGRWQSLVAPVLAFVGLLAVLVLALLNLDLMVGSNVVGIYFVLCLLVVIAFGLALALWFRSNRPHVYRRIGRQHEDIS